MLYFIDKKVASSTELTFNFLVLRRRFTNKISHGQTKSKQLSIVHIPRLGIEPTNHDAEANTSNNTKQVKYDNSKVVGIVIANTKVILTKKL